MGPNKPNEMLGKCLDVSRLAKMGFQPEIYLDRGVDRAIREYPNLRSQEINL